MGQADDARCVADGDPEGAPGDVSYAMYASSAYGGSGVSRPSAWIGGTERGRDDGSLPPDAWSHLAVTYDSHDLRLYINGAQVASKAFTGAITPSTGALRIGGNSIWGEYFDGQIDEMRVYNRALSASEIAADRDTPISGGSPPPPSDTTAPTASLTSPGAGTTVSGSVTVAANASRQRRRRRRPVQARRGQPGRRGHRVALLDHVEYHDGDERHVTP